MQEKKSTELIQIVVAGLSSEEYGIPITQVQEIIKIPAITKIPNMPDFIEGVINLRGKVIPIIDLKKRFGLEIKKGTEDGRIVVTNTQNQSVGFIADFVSEVIRVDASDIDPVPTIISSVSSEYLNGVCKLDKRIIILLNIEKVLSDIEKASLKKLEKEAARENEK
jgi:purine-binding chemotaxis protein CheW